MRTNTYIRLEMLYKKYKGYVETREILEEGFSNRQIAVLGDMLPPLKSQILK